jgi:hypothetical protein
MGGIGGAGADMENNAEFVGWFPSKTARFFSDVGGSRSVSTTWLVKGYLRVPHSELTEEEYKTEVQMHHGGRWAAANGTRFVVLNDFEDSARENALRDIVFNPPSPRNTRGRP